MALSPLIRRTIRWTAEGLREFAESRRWAADDFRVFHHVNETWDTVDFLFAVRDYPEDSHQLWGDVLEFLENRDGSRGRPELASGGLTIWPLERAERMLEGSSLYEEYEFEPTRFPKVAPPTTA